MSALIVRFAGSIRARALLKWLMWYVLSHLLHGRQSPMCTIGSVLFPGSHGTPVFCSVLIVIVGQRLSIRHRVEACSQCSSTSIYLFFALPSNNRLFRYVQ